MKMKSLIIIYMMLSILLLIKSECIENPAAATEDPDMPRAGCIILYDEKNYEGNSEELCDFYDEDDLDDVDDGWDDRVVSIRLGFKTSLVIYSDTNFSGDSYLLENSIRDLTAIMADWNEGVSSYRMIGVGCFVLFDGTGFLGPATNKICQGNYNIASQVNAASSILIGPDTKVRLFDGSNTNFNTPYATLDRSYDDLDDTNIGENTFDNYQIISDIPDGCVLWVNEGPWDGESEEDFLFFCGDTTNLDPDNLNDFGTAVFGGNTRVILFENTDFSGVTKILESTPGINGKNYNLDGIQISAINTNNWDYNIGKVVQLGPGCIFLINEEKTSEHLYVCKCTDKINKQWNNKKFKVYLGPGTQIQLGRKNLKDFFFFQGVEAYISPGIIKTISSSNGY